MNFQTFKLVLENTEEPKIKFPTSAGSSKKANKFQKNMLFCFTEFSKPLAVWIKINCGKF